MKKYSSSVLVEKISTFEVLSKITGEEEHTQFLYIEIMQRHQNIVCNRKKINTFPHTTNLQQTTLKSFRHIKYYAKTLHKGEKGECNYLLTHSLIRQF